MRTTEIEPFSSDPNTELLSDEPEVELVDGIELPKMSPQSTGRRSFAAGDTFEHPELAGMRFSVGEFFAGSSEEANAVSWCSGSSNRAARRPDLSSFPIAHGAPQPASSAAINGSDGTFPT